MNFMGIGPLELLLIFIITLIVFGPGRLPEFAATLGKTLRKLRQTAFELTKAMSEETEGGEEREEESAGDKEGDGQ